MTCAVLGTLPGCDGDSASEAKSSLAGGSAVSAPAPVDYRSFSEARKEARQKGTEPGVQRPEIDPSFTNVAKLAGLDFTYYNDRVPERFFLPEVMGGGVAWFDYDGDGRLDLYVQNGCRLEKPDPQQTEHLNRLYRNHGDGRFEDVTVSSGSHDPGYGQGCAVGDFNADGFPDLYLANYGANALLFNRGDGTFEDVTDQAGIGDPLWSSSTVWFDANEDGLLDLYLANYLDVDLETYHLCSYEGENGYCGPGEYEPLPDRVFLNRGDGRFRDATAELGFQETTGKGLSVTVADFDHDFQPELYIANDMTPNFLYTRSPHFQSAESAETEPTHGNESTDRPGTETTDAVLRPLSTDPKPSHSFSAYREVASAAGCAVSGNGMNEASMGIACADFDADGLMDIFLTHFYGQKNTLYRNLGGLVFVDDSRRARVAATGFDTLGFGTVPFDYDRDGQLDLFITNGHVLGPNYEINELRPQLLRNDGGGRFTEISAFAGDYFRGEYLGRGAAGADYDNDGDLDLLVTHLYHPMALLRNDTFTPPSSPSGRGAGGEAGRFLGLELQTPNRIPPFGARVTVTIGDEQRHAQLTGGGSYLCSGDPRLLFGLRETSGPASVTIRWPSGRVDEFQLNLNHHWRVMEGEPPRLLPGVVGGSRRVVQTAADASPL